MRDTQLCCFASVSQYFLFTNLWVDFGAQALAIFNPYFHSLQACTATRVKEANSKADVGLFQIAMTSAFGQWWCVGRVCREQSAKLFFHQSNPHLGSWGGVGRYQLMITLLLLEQCSHATPPRLHSCHFVSHCASLLYSANAQQNKRKAEKYILTLLQNFLRSNWWQSVCLEKTQPSHCETHCGWQRGTARSR